MEKTGYEEALDGLLKFASTSLEIEKTAASGSALAGTFLNPLNWLLMPPALIAGSFMKNTTDPGQVLAALRKTGWLKNMLVPGVAPFRLAREGTARSLILADAERNVINKAMAGAQRGI